jgi:GTP diphosphokinase / guanosine-3',5'-bis(diphosphate) 3'-diphosphatase
VDSREQVRSERRSGLLARLRPGEPDAPPAELDHLVRSVRAYNAKADVRELQRAFAFASQAHSGQKRLSGEDYVYHPLAVGQILAELGLDTTTLVAALLHDTVEDTPRTLDDLEREFGPDVARLVDGLTKIDTITSGR